MKLTPKQEKFCELYAQSGNATQSAVGAGYSKKTAEVIGCENLRKPNIADQIRSLTEAEKNTRIATAAERQEFLTSMFRDDEADPKDRLKATEVLGRMQGDFIDKLHLTGNVKNTVIHRDFTTGSK